jgi:hypothetical protein
MSEEEAQYGGEGEEIIPVIETEGEVLSQQRGGFKGKGHKKQPRQRDRANEDERAAALKQEILGIDTRDKNSLEHRNKDSHSYDSASVRELEHGRGVKINGNEVYVGDDGKPLNPFWKEQEELLSPREKFTENFFDSAARGYKKMKKFLRPLALKEDPDREKKRLQEYEDLVKNGHAEFFQEMEVSGGKKTKDSKKEPDLRLYKIMKKGYKKAEVDGYRFKTIGVYDENGSFTGKMRIYRIKK